MLDEMSHKIIGQNALLPPPRDLSCGARPNPYGMIFGARPGQTTDDQDDVLEFVVRPSEPVTEKPPLYKVVILNDDYTPMGFVIHVLQRFFGMEEQKATQIMLAIHTSGSAVCGIYTKDVAETKVHDVNQYSQENDHPLLSQIEATD